MLFTEADRLLGKSSIVLGEEIFSLDFVAPEEVTDS